MEKLRQLKLFRWAIYLLLLPAMVLRNLCIGARTGFDLWSALVTQHEAGWKRRLQKCPATGERCQYECHVGKCHQVGQKQVIDWANSKSRVQLMARRQPGPYAIRDHA